jgi:hypothetical protein
VNRLIFLIVACVLTSACSSTAEIPIPKGEKYAMNADVRFPGAPTVRPGMNAVTLDVAARYSGRGTRVPPPVAEYKPLAVVQQQQASSPSSPTRVVAERHVPTRRQVTMYLTEQRGTQCSQMTRVPVIVQDGEEVIGVLQALFEAPAHKLAFIKGSRGKVPDGEIEVRGSMVTLSFGIPPWNPGTQCGVVARAQLLATLKGVGIKRVLINVNGQRWESFET